MLPLVWLGLAIVAAVVELASPLFGFIFVTAAALIAAGTAWIGLSLELQLALFTGSLLGSLVVVRPRITRRLHSGRQLPSRTERLIGQRGEVTQAIDPISGGGRVLVAGEDWAAASAGDPVPLGTKVIIDGADGIVLNVTPED